jgi:CheY-like chemotaxis protein
LILETATFCKLPAVKNRIVLEGSSMSRLPEILRQHEGEINSNWLREMTSAVRRNDLLPEKQLQSECKEVLSALVEGANSGDLVRLENPAWNNAKELRSLPDLVILDIRLPDIPGYEVCRRIKQDPATAHIAVLQVSAFIGEQGKAAAIAAGADALLTHPIDPAVLLDVVARLLSAKKSASKP